MKNRISKDVIDLSELGKLEKEQFQEFTKNDEKLCVTAWVNSGPALMASSYYGSQSVSEVLR